MREIIVKVYQFNELNDDAKDKARQWFRQGNDYPWFGEYRDSLKSFEKVLPIKIKDYSYGEEAYRSYVRFDVTNAELMSLKGLRLRTWLINNFWSHIEKGKYLGHIKGKSVYSKMVKEVSCPFTGYCSDESLIEPIRKFLKSPDANMTFEELIKECFESFIQDVASDIEYQNSDECIDETIEANDYEFDANGERI